MILFFMFWVDFRKSCLVVRPGKNFQLTPTTFCLIFDLSGRIFGDGFGALRDSMLGELTWESEADSGLDFSGAQCGSFVDSGKFSGFSGKTVEGIVDEGVHDTHAFLGDSGIRVNLLKDFVDVGRVSLRALLSPSDRGFADSFL